MAIYIFGETKNALPTRMTLHRQQTNHEDLTLIRANNHFHRCSNGWFKIFPLYRVNRQNDFLRMKMEELFINILNPGLNDKWYSNFNLTFQSLKMTLVVSLVCVNIKLLLTSINCFIYIVSHITWRSAEAVKVIVKKWCIENIIIFL